jgi:hypothetical protein
VGTLASDQGERAVGRAVDRSVDGVYRPSASTPLFTYDSVSLVSIRKCKKEEEMLKIKMAGSKC